MDFCFLLHKRIKVLKVLQPEWSDAKHNIKNMERLTLWEKNADNKN